MAPVPIGIKLIQCCPGGGRRRDVAYRTFILVFTFFCYMSYHLSRRPISVVKGVLHQNCSHLVRPTPHPHDNNTKWCDWPPFEVDSYLTLYGSLDYAYLFSYAISMFFCGHIAERMNLRHFLGFGMMLCGVMTAAFGMGYFFHFHSLGFYVGVQVVGGFVQATGWPSVVTCVANWFGKGKRGLIMGVWNSHTSVGNILGSIIPAIWVNNAWGWSFIVPGMIIFSLGILVLLFLIPYPEDVGCSPPEHHKLPKSFSFNESTVEYSHSSYDRVQQNGLEDGAVVEEEEINYSDSEDSKLLSHQYQPPLSPSPETHKAITFCGALKIPGVIEFSLVLFFAKLVSYTFLFWLPEYIKESSKSGHLDAKTAADLSALFDVGGIVGGILAGVISDYTGARATTCLVMLGLAAPMMFLYESYASTSTAVFVVLLLCTGLLVNGPYALITTAVSADLGTHKSLQGNSKALATVTAIIDGTGSLGAALGPLFTGFISNASKHHGWTYVFYMLMASDVLALILLIRLVVKEFKLCCLRYSQYEANVQE